MMGLSNNDGTNETSRKKSGPVYVIVFSWRLMTGADFTWQDLLCGVDYRKWVQGSGR
jgi:hypothetical protein